MGNITANSQKGSLTLDLGGLTFANEKQLGSGQSYGIRAINATGIDQVLVLNPSYFGTDATKVVRDGPMPTPNLSCAATQSGKTIAEMQAWVKAGVCAHVMSVQIQSTLNTQLDQQISKEVCNPFRQNGIDYANIADAKLASNLNDRFLKVPLIDWYMTFEDRIITVIPGQMDGENIVPVTTTWIFAIGATFNPAALLWQTLDAANQ